MMGTIEHLSELARVRHRGEGRCETPMPDLSLYRYTNRQVEMPQTENLYLYLVLDGSLRLHTPSGMLDYMAGQYSVSRIDTPNAGQVLAFSPQGDFLALSLELTLHDVISVVLDLEGDLAERIVGVKLDEQTMTASDEAALEQFLRLLSVLDEPDQLAFLGKHWKREVVFRVLCGSCGSQFLQSVVNIRQAGEIYEINSWIKENFRDTFTVESLAEQWNMSVSLFHQRFKSAVGMGPLQCQKRLRLTEARRLMLDEGRNVTQAAMEVGYESVSQFTREYRRFFGQPPKEDIMKLRRAVKK